MNKHYLCLISQKVAGFCDAPTLVAHSAKCFNSMRWSLLHPLDRGCLSAALTGQILHLQGKGERDRVSFFYIGSGGFCNFGKQAEEAVREAGKAGLLPCLPAIPREGGQVSLWLGLGLQHKRRGQLRMLCTAVYVGWRWA